MIRATLTVIVLLSLSGCTAIHQHLGGQPTQENQICKQLKQQIALSEVQYNNASPQDTPTEMARLYQAYQKYDCAQRLGER